VIVYRRFIHNQPRLRHPYVALYILGHLGLLVTSNTLATTMPMFSTFFIIKLLTDMQCMSTQAGRTYLSREQMRECYSSVSESSSTIVC
jgi:hypothetical protein